MLGWRDELRRVGDLSRQIIWTHGAFIMLTIASIGLASLLNAGTLASGPTLAHAATKRALHEEWDMGIDEAIDYEAEVQAELMESEDFSRAYRAFVAKETPKFEGD